MSAGPDDGAGVRDREGRLDSAVGAYFEAEARGESPRPEEWIARYPDLADDLASFFAAEAGFRRLAAPGSAPAPAGDFPRPFGAYTLLRPIGRGGMGVVFEARHERLGRSVALKMIPDGLLPTPADLIRFRLEAGAVAKLDHPRIVPVFEAGEHEGRPYFAMKLVPGGSLADALDRHRDDPRAAARLVLGAAEAVHHAHRRGLLHRDLKPSNLLLDADGSALVTDFGLAKSLDSDSTLTETGALLGSPPYMAPEQAAGRPDQVTVATDVYGLGAVLYALLTGDAPFRGITPIETLDRVRNDAPGPPSRVNPRVDRDLETICLKCLEKDPRRRYDSAESLADDLRRWLDGRPILARRTGPAGRVAKWVRRHPVPAALCLALIVAVVGGMAGVVWQWREAVRARGGLEASLYDYRITLADRELEAGNVAQAEVLLEDCPPAFRGWEWRHLKRRRASRAFPLGGEVSGLAYRPDGARLAALVERAPKEIDLVVSDPRDGREVWRRPSGIGGLTTLAYSPDGRRLAAAGSAGPARSWDAEAGEEAWSSPPGPAGRFWGLAYSPDGRWVAAGGERAALLLDAGTGRLVARLDGHDDRVEGLAFSPDGSQLASASNDGTVRVWEIPSGRPRRVLREGSLVCLKCVAWSPDGRRLAAGSEFGTIVAWDARTGREQARVQAHTLPIEALAFDPTGRRLAAGGHDRLVKICDVETFRVLLTLRGHESIIWALSFRPDGSALASAAESIRLWDAAPPGRRLGDEAEILGGHDGRVEDIVLSADGALLASASYDRTVLVRDLATGAVRLRLTGGAGAMLAVAFRPGGREVAASGLDRVVRIWDLATGRERLALGGHDRAVSTLAYSPDGRTLASGAWGPRIVLHDADSGREVGRLSDFRGFVYDLAFDPAGRRLAAATDVTARAWDLETGTAQFVVEGSGGRVGAVAFSPDGRRLAVGGRFGVTIRDARTGREAFALPGTASEVLSLTYSRDGRLLASGHEDRAVAVWDASTGRLLARFLDAAGPIRRLAFDPAGRRLAATGGDTTARVWHLDRLPLP